MKYLITENLFKQAKEDAHRVTLEKIKALPVYKSISKMGIEITNKDLQFVFSLKADYIYDKDGKNDTLREFYGVKISPGFTRGNTKTYFSSGEIERTDYFDSNLIGGWEHALEDVRARLVRVKRKLEEKGYVVLTSKEEIHKKRGLIVGRQYGF